MNNEETRKTLKFLRSLDGILIGILFLIPLIILQNLFTTYPSQLIKYFYIIPVLIIFTSSFKIPYSFYNNKDWNKGVKRIRFFITGCLALSPFWAWWNQALEKHYLLMNLLFLILFAMLFIYNITSLSYISGLTEGWKRFANFAKLTRWAIMYIMIAPFFSLTICFWLLKNTCWQIVVFIFQNQRLILPLIIIPLLMSIFLIFEWRKKLVEK